MVGILSCIPLVPAAMRNAAVSLPTAAHVAHTAKIDVTGPEVRPYGLLPSAEPPSMTPNWHRLLLPRLRQLMHLMKLVELDLPVQQCLV